MAANFPNFVSRYLGLIPDQENYHDLNESVFDCFEEVKYDEDQKLKYYKPNINMVSKDDARKLFSAFNTRNDRFGSATPILTYFHNFRKKNNDKNS